MKKIINTLIFSVFIALSLEAAPILLSEDKPLLLKAASARPITVSTNFVLSGADLVVVNSNIAKLKLLKRGFIFIPLRQKYDGTVVLTSKDGKLYTINLTSGGKKTVFKVEDPIQSIKDDDFKGFEFESGKIDNDARNIIKTVLLDKNLSGFKKMLSYQIIKGNQFNMIRTERYIGGKYILDKWELVNTSAVPLYFNEEDFYTEGILAVAIEKNRVLKGERVFLMTLLNRNTVYELEKEGR